MAEGSLRNAISVRRDVGPGVQCKLQTLTSPSD